MHIYDIVKETMEKHKQKIELFQWAVMSGVSSLVYSEYIANIKQKQTPVRQILVPSIKTLKTFLDPDGDFMKRLSSDLVDEMVQNETLKKYMDAPELVLFSQDNIEVLKTIFDLYVLRNVSRYIPDVISKKFGLGDPNQQLIREDRDIMLFGYKPISDDQFNFIVEQVVLQLLLILPTMKKEIEVPENNRQIHMTDVEILTIANEKAICPIHFTPDIFHNESVIRLLKFVTSTSIEEVDISQDTVAVKGPNNDWITYLVSTEPFNQVSLTRLIGIQTTD